MATYKCQDYTICYDEKTKRQPAIIQNFIQIANKYFCVVRDLEKSSNLVESVPENAVLIEMLDKFFLICKKTDNYKILPVEKITEKCVLVENNNEFFISVYFDEIKS